MSYLVGQRTHEIGIRMALGATPRQVVAATMGDVAESSVAGAAIGLATALGLTRVMSWMLFGVSPNDPRAFAGAAAALLAVALAAGLVPARRATRVDPAMALKCD